MSGIETIIFPFIGGLGLFIFGMHTMAQGLQKSAGNKMRKWLEKVTNNRLMGVFIGFLVTAVIQSSSATTVMIVGFVNAGIMNVGQTIGLIMGANIGTTVTAWIVSSVEWARFLNPSMLAPLAVGLGAALAMFSTNEKYRRTGEIIVGFGVLFMGMSIMSDAVKPLSASETFRNMFAQMGYNPVIGILTGAAVTAIIQSSSASVGILQSLAAVGLVPWGAAVYIIMGQNIGTCVTAILSAIGANKSAKSAAYTHLMFNVINSVVFSVIAIIFFKFINPALSVQPIEMTEIGMVHTAFNIAGTALLFPFGDILVRMATRMAGVKEGASATAFIHLDDRMLENPSMALHSCLKEIERMGAMASENLQLSCESVLELDIDKVRKVTVQEETIDLLQQGITRFLAKICATPATNKLENETATSLFHTVNDIERVGDHAVNLAEVTESLISGGMEFSKSALREVGEMSALAQTCFNHSLEALNLRDKQLAEIAIDEEDATDTLRDDLRANHMDRLSCDECNPMSGVAFLDVITNLERVTDHAKNIAQTVQKSTYQYEI
ncbi:MAG: Na/Pi cotransporter family protein [Clostridiales bacterium]|nr:Na/Pi cotransporter family protein [Clostridiales bacterium]